MAKPGKDAPMRLFKPRKAAREMARITARAQADYRGLYKDGRSRTLDRAETVALEKIQEAGQADAEQVARDQETVEKGFWPKLKKVAQQIPFLEDLVAAYYAMRDSDTPLQARAALVFGLLYFLWVFDIIPDFIGILGYADDGTVLSTIIVQVGSAITYAHRAEAKKVLGLETD